MKKTIELLKKLISIPSFIGSKNPNSENGISDFLQEYFDLNLPSFNKTIIPFEGKRVNLLFQNSKLIKILFACHMDTVPPSSADALDLKIDGDKAYGLGTKDMKGGIVSTLLALKSLQNVPGVGVLFYGDEETTFKGMKALLKNAIKLFGESRPLIISPESRFNLGIGARGIITLNLKVYGLRAHSARPHLGIDAVKNTIHLIEETEKLLNKNKNPLGNTSLTIPKISGGLKEPDGSIGFHVGSVPDYVEAIVSVRNANTNLDGKKLIDLIKRIGENYNVKVEAEVIEDFPARYTPEELVKRVKKTIKLAGFDTSIGDPTQSGYNDVAILSKALNTHVINFGPMGDANHTKDEWVSLQSIIDTSKVFVALAKEFQQ